MADALRESQSARPGRGAFCRTVVKCLPEGGKERCSVVVGGDSCPELPLFAGVLCSAELAVRKDAAMRRWMGRRGVEANNRQAGNSSGWIGCRWTGQMERNEQGEVVAHKGSHQCPGFR